jgi:hypothetical protein
MKSNLERQQATGENMKTRRKDEEEEEEREIQVKEPKLQRTLGGSAARRRSSGAQELGAAAAAAVATKGWTKDSVAIFYSVASFRQKENFQIKYSKKS